MTLEKNEMFEDNRIAKMDFYYRIVHLLRSARGDVGRGVNET